MDEFAIRASVADRCLVLWPILALPHEFLPRCAYAYLQRGRIGREQGWLESLRPYGRDPEAWQQEDPQNAAHARIIAGIAAAHIVCLIAGL